jgi:hypothetical protein
MNEPSAHAPCMRITFEALVIPLIPAANDRDDAKAGVLSERPRAGNPVPIDQGDGIR